MSKEEKERCNITLHGASVGTGVVYSDDTTHAIMNSQEAYDNLIKYGYPGYFDTIELKGD